MADGSVPVVILCGGRGTRLSSYDSTIPKPLAPIGDRPILWHIMKLYSTFGHEDFVLALGWLGEEIRRYFLHYDAMTRDFTLKLGEPGNVGFHDSTVRGNWQVTCKDTGRDTLTGTRVRKAMDAISCDTFMVTYGDCIGDIDIPALLECHRQAGRLATITAVQPPSRFGELTISDGGQVTSFVEKPQTSTGAINGGFMVFQREALDRYFPRDGDYMLEREPLGSLASDGQLTAYTHHGFWQPMDTPRERMLLEGLWTSGEAPWCVWKDSEH